MKIIKFGGSTFKNENDIFKTIEFIQNLHTNNTEIVIIISAFDKFTSILNEIVNNIISQPTQFNYEFNKIKLFISSRLIRIRRSLISLIGTCRPVRRVLSASLLVRVLSTSLLIRIIAWRSL